MTSTPGEQKYSYEDVGRHCQGWWNQCLDSAGEWQSRTCCTDQRKGREARRGSTEAGMEERRRGERCQEWRSGWTGDELFGGYGGRRRGCHS
jgi:hypothetical protein